MKLRNKKTGEIVEVCKINPEPFEAVDFNCSNLAELNEDWEDYEEPKDDATRVITSFINYVEEADESFYCDKSVKKLVDKLKAWKRLKDKGCKINHYELIGGTSRKDGFRGEICIYIDVPNDIDKYLIDLLFGGEE